MLRALSGSLLMLLVVSLLPMNGSAEPSNCQGLVKALGAAQGEYNKAAGAWRQATVRVSQAEWEQSLIEGRLNANDKKTAVAQSELASAQEDQAACEAFERGEAPAPLIDCSKVPGRVKKAERDLANCEATGAKLESELEAAKQLVEQREDEATAAHAAERAAAAVLEAAKAAAAGCRTTA